MTLGAGLLLVYILIQTKLNTYNQNKEYYCKDNKYLKIDDNSKTDINDLKKEFLKLKSETTNLRKSLNIMNLHLRNIHDCHRNLDINLADFAAEAFGGLVIDTPNTQFYFRPKSTQMTLFGIPIWKPNYYTPRKIIQPWSQPGQCWAFRGSQGKIEIELAHTVFINRVTLEHIPASASLTGIIDSAPKMFRVLGKFKGQYVLIDTFLYKDNGPPSQTFEIMKPEIKSTSFKRIIIEILSNWGNPYYTCIYRFKVHGKVDIISDGEDTTLVH